MNTIIVDKKRCGKCGICISFFDGYCMTEEDGSPVIDRDICNRCQKCITICPHQAISMNGIPPTRITDELIEKRIGYDELVTLLRFRRSTKRFVRRDVPKDIITKIAKSAKYAPNQNKNIEILIIDDPEIIRLIDLNALNFIKRLYKLMFSLKLVTRFVGIFSGSIYIIKKKMERDLFVDKRIVKENTNVILLTIGNPRVPTTEMSAQYLLETMMLTAVSLDIGCTLMDSIKLTINHNRKLKRMLGIGRSDKVLGVLTLGYSGENRLNIPNGYEVNLHWNAIGN